MKHLQTTAKPKNRFLRKPHTVPAVANSPFIPSGRSERGRGVRAEGKGGWQKFRNFVRAPRRFWAVWAHADVGALGRGPPAKVHGLGCGGRLIGLARKSAVSHQTEHRSGFGWIGLELAWATLGPDWAWARLTLPSSGGPGRYS